MSESAGIHCREKCTSHGRSARVPVPDDPSKRALTSYRYGEPGGIVLHLVPRSPERPRTPRRALPSAAIGPSMRNEPGVPRMPRPRAGTRPSPRRRSRSRTFCRLAVTSTHRHSHARRTRRHCCGLGCGGRRRSEVTVDVDGATAPADRLASASFAACFSAASRMRAASASPAPVCAPRRPRRLPSPWRCAGLGLGPRPRHFRFRLRSCLGFSSDARRVGFRLRALRLAIRTCLGGVATLFGAAVGDAADGAAGTAAWPPTSWAALSQPSWPRNRSLDQQCSRRSHGQDLVVERVPPSRGRYAPDRLRGTRHPIYVIGRGDVLSGLVRRCSESPGRACR